jgi:hypothetical protein
MQATSLSCAENVNRGICVGHRSRCVGYHLFRTTSNTFVGACRNQKVRRLRTEFAFARAGAVLMRYLTVHGRSAACSFRVTAELVDWAQM